MHDLMIALVPIAGAVSMVQLKDRLGWKTSLLSLVASVIGAVSLAIDLRLSPRVVGVMSSLVIGTSVIAMLIAALRSHQARARLFAATYAIISLPLALAPILPVAPLSFSAVVGSVFVAWLVFGRR